MVAVLEQYSVFSVPLSMSALGMCLFLIHTLLETCSAWRAVTADYFYGPLAMFLDVRLARFKYICQCVKMG